MIQLVTRRGIVRLWPALLLYICIHSTFIVTSHTFNRRTDGSSLWMTMHMSNVWLLSTMIIIFYLFYFFIIIIIFGSQWFNTQRNSTCSSQTSSSTATAAAAAASPNHENIMGSPSCSVDDTTILLEARNTNATYCMATNDCCRMHEAIGSTDGRSRREPSQMLGIQYRWWRWNVSE
jgi:hypothetical protein